MINKLLLNIFFQYWQSYLPLNGVLLNTQLQKRGSHRIYIQATHFVSYSSFIVFIDMPHNNQHAKITVIHGFHNELIITLPRSTSTTRASRKVYNIVVRHIEVDSSISRGLAAVDHSSIMFSSSSEYCPALRCIIAIIRRLNVDTIYIAHIYNGERIFFPLFRHVAIRLETLKYFLFVYSIEWKEKKHVGDWFSDEGEQKIIMIHIQIIVDFSDFRFSFSS